MTPKSTNNTDSAIASADDVWEQRWFSHLYITSLKLKFRRLLTLISADEVFVLARKLEETYTQLEGQTWKMKRFFSYCLNQSYLSR